MSGRSGSRPVSGARIGASVGTRSAGNRDGARLLAGGSRPANRIPREASTDLRGASSMDLVQLQKDLDRSAKQDGYKDYADKVEKESAIEALRAKEDEEMMQRILEESQAPQDDDVQFSAFSYMLEDSERKQDSDERPSLHPFYLGSQESVVRRDISEVPKAGLMMAHPLPRSSQMRGLSRYAFADGEEESMPAPARAARFVPERENTISSFMRSVAQDAHEEVARVAAETYRHKAAEALRNFEVQQLLLEQAREQLKQTLTAADWEKFQSGRFRPE